MFSANAFSVALSFARETRATLAHGHDSRADPGRTGARRWQIVITGARKTDGRYDRMTQVVTGTKRSAGRGDGRDGDRPVEAA